MSSMCYSNISVKIKVKFRSPKPSLVLKEGFKINTLLVVAEFVL